MRKIGLRYDLTGKKFGRLTVLSFDHVSKNRGSYWKCKCDCGNISIPQGRCLRLGQTKSCGCYQKEQAKERNRIKIGEASFNRLFRVYKRNAKNRELEFSLTKNKFIILTTENCFYCGCAPNTMVFADNSNGNYVYNGIDRVDNSKGYTDDNCVPCCKICNKAKLKMTKDDFLSWITKVYKHSIMRGDIT
jgi:hypothetical protein